MPIMTPSGAGPFSDTPSTGLYEYQFDLVKQALDQWNPSEEHPPLIVSGMWEGMEATQFSRNPDLSIRCPAMRDIQQAARNSKTCPCICWFQDNGSLGFCSGIDVKPNQIGLIEQDGTVYNQLAHDHGFIAAAKALGLVENTLDITALIVSKLARDEDYWRNRIQQGEIGLMMWHESASLGLKPIIENTVAQNKKKIKEYWIQQVCNEQITARDLCLYFIRVLTVNVAS